MIKFFGYKKCGTCRKAEKALSDMGVSYQFQDITLTPPSDSELSLILKGSGMSVMKAFNSSGVQYKEEGWSTKTKGLSPEEAEEALRGNGRLMKRPMVTDGQKATIGFDERVFRQTWGK